MAGLRELAAEERALVAFAALSMEIFAVTHSERTYELAREAMARAEDVRRDAEKLRSGERDGNAAA